MSELLLTYLLADMELRTFSSLGVRLILRPECCEQKSIIIDISIIKLLLLAADVIWGTSQWYSDNLLDKHVSL